MGCIEDVAAMLLGIRGSRLINAVASRQRSRRRCRASIVTLGDFVACARAVCTGRSNETSMLCARTRRGFDMEASVHASISGPVDDIVIRRFNVTHMADSTRVIGLSVFCLRNMCRRAHVCSTSRHSPLNATDVAQSMRVLNSSLSASCFPV